MFLNIGKRFVLLSILSLVFVCSQTAAAQDKSWREVTPAELQMKKPLVEPDADAEAIFWEVRLDDKKAGKLSYNHYVRVKIFTERGREKFSKFDIPFYKGKKVEDVAARVIKADGTVVNLPPTDIFEREIVKANKVKVKAKSFAVPGIEPGVIVEYQYSETFKNDSAGGERLLFQRDIPLQKAVYYVRPYKGSKLNFVPFNTADVRFMEDENHFYVGTMTNVPALKLEPYMPPEDEVRRWTFLSYSPLNISSQPLGAAVGWSLFAVRHSLIESLMIKKSKNLKKLADEITAGAASDDEKLEKIYKYVQTQIKNVNYDTAMTEDEKEDIDIDKIEDIVKEKAGAGFHINLLCGALASAVGFDARLYYSSNRSEMFFDPDKVSNGGFLHNAGIAVKVGDKWRFVDPGTPYLGYGDMFWHDQGTVGMMITEQGGYSWIRPAYTAIEKSLSKRTGKFKLLEDGTLEGDVKLEYTGNQAVSRREDGYRDSAAQREKAMEDEIKQRISNAEISKLTVENFNDSYKPLTYTFSIRIPNYAQKTGKRLFLQPGFFEYGTEAVFSSATRVNQIYFPYPWSENDELEIELPRNFALDNADAPGKVEDPQKIGSLQVTISIDKPRNAIKYQRKFHFGGSNNILFPANAYIPVKNMFDAFYKADNHTVTLKQN